MNEITLTLGALSAATGLFIVGLIVLFVNYVYKRMRPVDSNDLDIEFNNSINDIRRITSEETN